MNTMTSTALVPYKAPLVALITPGGPVTRVQLIQLIAEGHDVSSIATFHRGAGRSRPHRVFLFNA